MESPVTDYETAIVTRSAEDDASSEAGGMEEERDLEERNLLLRRARRALMALCGETDPDHISDALRKYAAFGEELEEECEQLGQRLDWLHRREEVEEQQRDDEAAWNSVQPRTRTKTEVGRQDEEKNERMRLAAVMRQEIKQEWFGDHAQGTSLHQAAVAGHASVVRALVDAGANVQQATADGWTALHWAAYEGHEAAVETLLDLGADACKGDSDGCTPVDYARMNQHDVCVTMLSAAPRR